MDRKMFDLSRTFIYQNARPLDLARWRFHFEGGDRAAVLDALAAYQNADGGFGHALEPDCWNPLSTPMQTWAATETLHEIGFDDPEHPVMRGILRYLGSGAGFDGSRWYNAMRSNNDYPHAPWWHSDADTAGRDCYNPSACLAGFLIRYAGRDSAAYELGARVAREAMTAVMDNNFKGDMHTLRCYVMLCRYCEDADADEVIDLCELRQRLLRQIRRMLTHDAADWASGYVCRPSQFFNSRESMFYRANLELAEREADFIESSQLPDGTWPVTWSWSEYPAEWAISRNWWQGDIIVRNMLYLKGLERLGESD